MANAPRPKVRRSRALGIALTPKCARHLDERPYPPGQHGRRVRRGQSDYAVRLLEKQRLRAQYDVSEKQLQRAYDAAHRAAGRTGEVLISDLETRLDALVLRSGFARTIYQARQAVVHRHVVVDGERVDRPSYRVRPGQVVQVAERSRAKDPFVVAAAGAHAGEGGAPAYLKVDLPALTARLVRRPERPEVPVVCDEQLVVEHYAR
ncbi:30S ribosomal protein S4 [Vallicoccus soli]|uniref:Small ribosomal subunit protein uS4 n=1 Tax=Vallicoccus soli TaxID=2339232 RepID=A0A3A3ZAN6_9ACTN|nr:30S ribosomal protein S4 [Vallicoccus soli]RJK98146.1 30S ribosomal protein S4 [Vallicoccus soli]